MVIYGSSSNASFIFYFKRVNEVKDLKNLDLGREGEDIAAEFLKSNGVCILERNYKCVFGEIDIIACAGDTISFIEVKTRRSMTYGRPYEAVGKNKQSHIRKVAEFYIRESESNGENPRSKEFRFDIMEILVKGKNSRINYIEGAF